MSAHTDRRHVLIVHAQPEPSSLTRFMVNTARDTLERAAMR